MASNTPPEPDNPPLVCTSARPNRRTSRTAFCADPPDPDDPLLGFAPYVHAAPRRNSITPDRQRSFIAALAATGIVTQAARVIGASLEALYKLRNLPGAEGFAAAWEQAIDRGVARLEDCVLQRAIEGEERPIWRNGEEAVVFPSPAPPHDPDELREVLGKTLGVPLFQEQAMKLAITAAGFTPSQADGLRRAMATFRNRGTVEHYRELLISGMTARGYQQDFAERCFEQIRGFGEYGFPESHAQAFGWLAYVSSWLKCRHPAVFTCALLNSQPMGFYAPAQLVRDAQEHGVEVRPIDVNASGWDCSLEQRDNDRTLALRLGLARIDGFRQTWAEAIATARPFASIEDLAHRAALPSPALRKLADADAFASLCAGRREGLWAVRRTPATQLPLFASTNAPELGIEPDAHLPAMPLTEEVVADYQTTRLSLKGHPMQFLRMQLRKEGVLTCADANAAPDGRKVRVAGVVLIRQRPGKGNAVFITLEDETGIANALLWSRDMERQRRTVMASRLMLVEAEVQRSDEGVVHLIVQQVIDRTAMLADLSERGSVASSRLPADEAPCPQATHSHPRNVRILPQSRDFH